MLLGFYRPGLKYMEEKYVEISDIELAIAVSQMYEEYSAYTLI